MDLNCVVCGDKGRKSGDKGVKAKVVRHGSNVEDTEKMGTDGEDNGGDVENSDNLDLDDSNEDDDDDLDEGGDDDDLDLDEGGDDDDLDLDEGGDDLDLDEGGDDDDLDLDEGGDDLDLDEGDDDLDLDEGGDDDGDLDGNDEDIDLEGEATEEVPCAELVEVRDNIPDDEFEAMVRGDENPQQGKEEPSMLLCSGEGGEEEKDLLVALILVPTRELALQVYAHIKDAAKYTSIRVCQDTSVNRHMICMHRVCQDTSVNRHMICMHRVCQDTSVNRHMICMHRVCHDTSVNRHMICMHRVCQDTSVNRHMICMHRVCQDTSVDRHMICMHRVCQDTSVNRHMICMHRLDLVSSSGMCAGGRHGYREAGSSAVTEALHRHSNTWEAVENDE